MSLQIRAAASLQIRAAASLQIPFLPRRHSLSYPLRPSFTRLAATSEDGKKTTDTAEDGKKTTDTAKKTAKEAKKKDDDDDDFETWVLVAVIAAVKSSRLLRIIKKFFNSWMKAKSKVSKMEESDKTLEERIKALTENLDTSVNGIANSSSDSGTGLSYEDIWFIFPVMYFAFLALDRIGTALYMICVAIPSSVRFMTSTSGKQLFLDLRTSCSCLASQTITVGNLTMILTGYFAVKMMLAWKNRSVHKNLEMIRKILNTEYKEKEKVQKDAEEQGSKSDVEEQGSKSDAKEN